MPKRNWTDEQRKAQAEKIKSWNPSGKSTGPKTESGKAASSRNSLKHGEHSAPALEIKSLLREQGQFLGLIEKALKK